MVIQIEIGPKKSTVQLGYFRKMLMKSETKGKKSNFLLDILREYCHTSTIHGIGYLGAKDKSLLEKVWWIIMFLLSLTTCCYLISRTWIKWKANPVILSFQEEQTPIWAIPFPAVTVCPLNKVKQGLYNYTDIFPQRDDLNDTESKIFWDLSLVCSLEQYKKANITGPYEFTDEEAINNIKEYAPTVYNTFMEVFWQNKLDSKYIFSNQLTEDGLCYTFNTFNQQHMYTKELNHNVTYISEGISPGDWNLENGYSKTNEGPRRAVKDGSTAGLSFKLLASLVDIDTVCGLPISGYKVILHSPAEAPKTTQQYFLIPFNRKITIIVRPDLITTSPNLKSLKPQERKCYFSNERSLRFFKVYTQNNCRVECDANVTKEYCGCVPFYMPRDNKTLICGYARLDCVRQIGTIILDLEITKTIVNTTKEERKKIENAGKIVDNCQCLPACNSLYYTSETSQTEIHMLKSLMNSGTMGSKMPQILQELIFKGIFTITQVDIFFKESQFLALSRNELYGQTDFLANCGGLLGLFMGVSILSLLEIVYFLTLRILFKYTNRHKNK